jgi:hypothetical protein
MHHEQQVPRLRTIIRKRLIMLCSELQSAYTIGTAETVP